MYCCNCGEKSNGENYCFNCGNKLNSVITNNNVSNGNSDGLRTASIVLGIIGIIGNVLIVFFPITFILSLIGLILGINANKKERNVLGIVLNSIGLFLSTCIIAFFVFLFNIIINIGTSDYYDYDNNNDYEVEKYYY